MNTLPHEPYFMGEDCRPQLQTLNVSDDELRRRHYMSIFEFQHAVAARCSLLLVADYLDWLKQQGVYDNTKIVLVSDHGFGGPVEDRSSRAVAGGAKDNRFTRSRSLLMVKPRDAHGPIQADERFLPNAEVPRLLCEDIGGCTNPYLGDRAIAANGRDDPFYVDFIPWQFSEQTPKAFILRSQMALTGKDPYDVNKWREIEAP
jgi:hypothetical protein